MYAAHKRAAVCKCVQSVWNILPAVIPRLMKTRPRAGISNFSISVPFRPCNVSRNQAKIPPPRPSSPDYRSPIPSLPTNRRSFFDFSSLLPLRNEILKLPQIKHLRQWNLIVSTTIKRAIWINYSVWINWILRDFSRYNINHSPI